MKTAKGRFFCAIARSGGPFLAASILVSATAQDLGVWKSSNISGTNNWSSVAASADGVRLAATSYDDPKFNLGQIYVSTNAGTTWTVTSAPSNYWYAITSSTNGDKLAAAVFGGGIYLSSDGGTSWRQSTNAPYGVWYAIASSWDGSRIVAVSGGVNRFIYTSPDAGQTWISNNVPDSEYWYAVASSADGQRLFAVSNSNTNGGAGAIYRSINGGVSWSSNDVASLNWTGIACSGDGMNLVACGFNSALYTSADGGLNWNAVPGLFGFFTGVTSSADGSRVTVISNGGQIYTSMDSAGTWISNSAPALAWQEVTSSKDGNMVVAAVPSDQIYTLQSAPMLRYSTPGGAGLVSWPWPSPGFLLQHNVDLSTTSWQTTVKPPLLTNWQYQLPVLQNSPQNFFRLKAP